MLRTLQIETKVIPKNMTAIIIAQAFLDLLMLSGAFGLAYLLRFDFNLTGDTAEFALLQMLIIVPYQFILLRLFKVHKFIWRHVGLIEMNHIMRTLLIAALPMFFLRFIFSENPNITVVPISIIIMNFFLTNAAILGIRLLRREIHENSQLAKNSMLATERKSVLLIGAGRAGALTLAELKTGRNSKYKVKGFIDDDSLKAGLFINGIQVIGKTQDIPQRVRELKIDQVIITIAQASRLNIQRILHICEGVPVKVKTIPSLAELLDEKVTVSRIRDVEVGDLLGRSPVELDKESIKAFLSGKIVLVTGAGGSIGSELVRQLIHCQTKQLILVERSEFALFNIEKEIRQNNPQIEIFPVIGDVCDTNRMSLIFQQYHPQVVFHAAAHKHVPLMEYNPGEALKNNVLGTQNIGLLAGQAGVEAFVLISTDKAVNPTSIMGATKRVAELIVQDLDTRFPTRFVAVRFGNVIGSNGSVIPIFREQIKNGGPVTVTHPEMQRFFMTIPEASQLVLQAGAIGAGGEIFILDMGEPVKILDLARETIRLSGLKPDEDIQIVYTGMRPGEKLVEEIETVKEQLVKTVHSKIFIGKIAPYAGYEVMQAIDTIKALCISEDDLQIRQFLSELIPEATLNIPQNSQIEKTSSNHKKQLYKLNPVPTHLPA